MKKYKYNLVHICNDNCNPIKGQHNYNISMKLCRINKRGEFIHISFDRNNN
jgi:hypothetical protein